MRSAIVENGIVVNVIVGLIDDAIPCNDSVGIGWVYASGKFTPPVIEDTRTIEEKKAELLKDYQTALQIFVDSVALSKGYNDAATLAGYANSTIPQWANEAQIFIAWRDQFWIEVHTLLTIHESDPDNAPDSNAILALLPQINWDPE